MLKMYYNYSGADKYPSGLKHVIAGTNWIGIAHSV